MSYHISPLDTILFIFLFSFFHLKDEYENDSLPLFTAEPLISPNF